MATQISVNSSTGNIQVTTSRTAIGTVVSANTANYANFAGQANIASRAIIADNANYAYNANVANTANFANIANTATNLSAVSTANVVIGGGTAGYVLSTDGSGTLSWVEQTGGSGGGTPGGANTFVQFNDNGTFGGEANFTYNKVNDVLTVDHIAGEGGNLSNIQIANVTGIGNVAVLNLDGNVSNVLRGDGTFSADTTDYSNSNVVSLMAAFGSNVITTTGNIDAGNLISTGNIDIANHVNVTPDGVVSTAPINTLSYGTNPSALNESAVAIIKRGRGDSATPASINLFDSIGDIEWHPQTIDGNGNFEGSFSAGIIPYVTGISGNIVATNMRLYTKSDTGALNFVQLDKNGTFRNDGETQLNNNLFVSGNDPANPKTIQSYNGGVTVIMDNINSAYPSFVFNTYNNTGSVINPYTFYRARGDQNTPAQVQGGDVVKSEQWYAYADSGNTYHSLGGLNAIVSANDGAGNVQVNSSITSGTTSGALNRTNGSKFIIDTNFTQTTNDLQVGNDTSTGGNLTLFRNADGSSSGVNPQGFITNYNRIYGSFEETSSIVLGSALTPTRLAITSTHITNNITNSAGLFTVDVAGVYTVEVEAQLLSSAPGGTDYSAWFWLRVNGTDVADSLHTFNIRGARTQSGSFMEAVSLNASDQVEVMWAVENTAVTCVARAANSQGFTHPAQHSASVIITPIGA